MLRSSICTAGALLICSSSALAQDNAGTLVRPIQGNVHERAVRVDMQTGQAHRLPANTINNDGVETVYDNTCPTGYFLGLNTQTQNGPGSTGPMAAGDWGGLPATAFAGNSGCTPGCADSYEISEFVFAYCTSDGVAIDMVLHFWDRTANGRNSCDGSQLVGGVVPPAVATVASLTVTGLPRSSAAGPTPACYAIQIVLGTPGFTLTGGTNFPALSTMGHRFSWSMQVTNGTGGAGPILAGNALFGTPCTFCAGTIWEIGGQTTNPGIGLGQDNHFWIDSYNGTTPATGNCYFLGGNPWAGFFLTLDAFKPCISGTPSFCDDSDGSLASCPCGNPGNPDTGCDNAQATGGVKINLVAQTTSPNNATVTGTGFSTMGAPTAIVLRSDSLDPSSPVVFGDGLRCVNAAGLVRLAATTAIAGTSTHVFGHASMAGPGDFFYQIWYRNTPSTFCDPFAAFNLSNGVQIDW
jgi:hypothetical protein